ncbi:hypothetical protein [Mesorhizobium loti]|uniref:Uncharacterized protein n=1 Tax=Mesorhizobium loti R88b TaxID=935548 RepID=A0A6M7WXW6_RHILI|nr:hypothetical protein [Mesorhizobium loti]QKD05439.1 hypothetical protein EB235_31410 [Mesorhizobium loti R88b]
MDNGLTIYAKAACCSYAGGFRFPTYLREWIAIIICFRLRMEKLFVAAATKDRSFLSRQPEVDETRQH